MHVNAGSAPASRLISITPFEELFFNERLVCGLTVRAALEQLEQRYATCRRLVLLAE